MNRISKEENKKYQSKVENLTIEDKNNYDTLLNLQKSFDSLVQEFHVKLFGEEYDYIYDDLTDIKKRKLGENPMSKEHTQKVNSKRAKLGFLPLDKSGYAVDGKNTMEYCKKLITSEIEYESIYLDSSSASFG